MCVCVCVCVFVFIWGLANKKEEIYESEKREISTRSLPTFDVFLSAVVSFLQLCNVKVLFTNPSARAGYDTRSIFNRSLTGFNSEFSFS